MSPDEKQYAGVIGFVFKDPELTATKTGKGLRRLLVSEANSRNGFYSVTVWDESHAGVAIAAGDLVCAQGGYDENTKDGRTFKNISARHFINLGSGVGTDTGGGGNQQASSTKDDDPFG